MNLTNVLYTYKLVLLQFQKLLSANKKQYLALKVIKIVYIKFTIENEYISKY